MGLTLGKLIEFLLANATQIPSVIQAVKDAIAQFGEQSPVTDEMIADLQARLNPVPPLSGDRR